MSEQQKLQRIDMAEKIRISMFSAGIALVSYGAWLASPPAGFITGGMMMFGCAVVGAYRAGK